MELSCHHSPQNAVARSSMPSTSLSRRLSRLAGRNWPNCPLPLSRFSTSLKASAHPESPEGWSDDTGIVHLLGASPWLDVNDTQTPKEESNSILSLVHCIPLLGRYDLIRYERARPTARINLPAFSVQEIERQRDRREQYLLGASDAKIEPYRKRIFFLRQQFGLLFCRPDLSNPEFFRRWGKPDDHKRAQAQRDWYSFIKVKAR